MTPADPRLARELLDDAEPDAGGWEVLLCESPSALILVAPPTRLVLQRGAGITDAQARLMMAAPDLARALLAAVAERDALAGQVAAWVAAWRATGLDAFLASEGIRAVLADTAVTAAEHARRVRVTVLAEAVAAVLDLEPTWDRSEDGAYVRAAETIRALAEEVDRG